MNFKFPLIHGRLIKRYKRFLTDVKLDSGEIVLAHCTNSGSMKSCLEKDAEVYLSPAENPERKTKFTWEMIKIDGKWVGINTSVPNIIVYDAVKEGKLPGFSGYETVKREVKYGKNSRVDVYLENEDEKCFIEVKNITLKVGDYAKFPDAVTERGKKHLIELMDMVNEGHRAAMVFVVQRQDVKKFAPAEEIDPNYAKTLKKAYENGVEIVVLQVEVTPLNIEICGTLPFEL